MKYVSLIVGILIILLVVAGGVLLWQRQPAPVEPTPIEPTTPTEPTEPVEPTTPQEPSSVQVPEGWKTYTNEEFGFAFDYPGELGVGGAREYKTEYGRQIYIPIDRPEMEFGVRIYEGLNIDQLREQTRKIFTKSEIYKKVTIQEEMGKFGGIILIVTAETDFIKGTQRILLLQHPRNPDISLEIGSSDIVKESDKIIESLHFL